jgi:hypothetical protein
MERGRDRAGLVEARRMILRDAMTVGVPTRQESGARGAAERCLAMRILELDALVEESLFDRWEPLEETPGGAGREVVDHDDDDVRPPVGCPRERHR